MRMQRMHPEQPSVPIDSALPLGEQSIRPEDAVPASPRICRVPVHDACSIRGRANRRSGFGRSGRSTAPHWAGTVLRRARRDPHVTV